MILLAGMKLEPLALERRNCNDGTAAPASGFTELESIRHGGFLADIIPV
jgi:hypothetical protein